MSNISINNAIPENALERQLYFIEKCKEHVAQLKKELNRPLLCCTQTFGCQMNVYINTKSMKNREKAEELNTKANDLMKQGIRRADEIYTRVLEQLA